MLRILLRVAIVCGFLAGMVTVTMAADGMLPKTDGAAVYQYITKTNPYQQWALFPGKGKLYVGKHPHGAFLTTYVNDQALKGIQDKAGTLPDGSIIVKENYSPEKKLAVVTVMYRTHGYDPNAGDWFWAKYKVDGSILAEGKVNSCIGCHATKIENDWIFTGPVK